MKVGDKLIYKLNQNLPIVYDFDYIDNAYYYNKEYEIIGINDEHHYFIDERGYEDFFVIDDSDCEFYIWNHFYTQQELRQLKLNSI
ncbi:hypothetical protein M0Q50_07425 [bacterium]|jgi:hypothetical protein|nr:hypothetical protein [bacterium]